MKLFLSFFLVLAYFQTLSYNLGSSYGSLIIETSLESKIINIVELNGNKGNILKLDSNIFLIKEVYSNAKYNIILFDSIILPFVIFDSVSNFYIGGTKLKYISLSTDCIKIKNECVILNIVKRKILSILGNEYPEIKKYQISKFYNCEKITNIYISEVITPKPYHIYKKIPKKIRKNFSNMDWRKLE
jgi:hypothetical protein